MKTARICFIAICGICVLSVAAYNCCFKSKLYLSPSELNLGALHQGKKIDAVVSLHNAGHRTICIQSVDTSCECINAAVSKKELEPGDAAKVKVYMDTKTLSGHIYRLITIQTDTHINSTIFIPISCEVIKDSDACTHKGKIGV